MKMSTTIKERFLELVGREPRYEDEIIEVMTDHFEQHYLKASEYWTEEEFGAMIQRPVNHVFHHQVSEVPIMAGVYDTECETVICVADLDYLEEIGASCPEEAIRMIENTAWDCLVKG
jgi:hypothetical protein